MSKSAQAFGYAPRPFEETLRDMIRWAVFLGRVDPAGLLFDTAPDPTWVKRE